MIIAFCDNAILQMQKDVFDDLENCESIELALVLQGVFGKIHKDIRKNVFEQLLRPSKVLVMKTQKFQRRVCHDLNMFWESRQNFEIELQKYL